VKKITIRRFARYKMGEGLQRRGEDFGGEVASLLGLSSVELQIISRRCTGLHGSEKPLWLVKWKCQLE